MPCLTSAEAARARSSLLGWFRRHARKLPWRESKSSYAIWLSEVMLQQTQIATAIPYYLRFLAEFPTAGRLAAAPLERVLELWSGLGYYRRARNLHLAARLIAEKHGGQFPRDYEQARRLPGVGDYTARAVLSIAYHEPYAVLDGNVARVMARLAALSGSLPEPRFRRTLEENLDRLLSRRSPGNFNQALMELGQTLCLPRSPECPRCPLKRWCRAYGMGKPESYPQPRPRRQVEKWHLATAVLHQNHRFLLTRGLEDGLLDGLWNFPSALGESRSKALERLSEKLRVAAGIPIAFGEPCHKLHHNITYRSIQVQIYAAELPESLRVKGCRWFAAGKIEQAAVSQLARKVLREHAREGPKARPQMLRGS
ncbi:MAG TPA: A/G-specific adenine glycosylase [Terriglobia bacterium]|nr:A/G-specific adenine glycosylase [Terriglobia bacterium]